MEETEAERRWRQEKASSYPREAATKNRGAERRNTGNEPSIRPVWLLEMARSRKVVVHFLNLITATYIYM